MLRRLWLRSSNSSSITVTFTPFDVPIADAARQLGLSLETVGTALAIGLGALAAVATSVLVLLMDRVVARRKDSWLGGA